MISQNKLAAESADENSKIINDSLNSNSITIYEDYNPCSSKSPIPGPSGITTRKSVIPAHVFSASDRRPPNTYCNPITAGNENWFESLSDEVILQIFKYLPKKALFRISLVCQRFRQIALDESIWIRMDLGNKSLRSGKNLVWSILRSIPIFVRKLLKMYIWKLWTWQCALESPAEGSTWSAKTCNRKNFNCICYFICSRVF